MFKIKNKYKNKLIIFKVSLSFSYHSHRYQQNLIIPEFWRKLKYEFDIRFKTIKISIVKDLRRSIF